jgi:hypothetical protein
VSVAIFVIGIVAAALIGYLGYAFKKKRREALARMAASLGLEYSQEDPYDLKAMPFALFGLGDGRGTENVLSGTWQGIPLRECDYWYYDESTDSKGHRSRTYHRFSCAIMEVPLESAGLTIGRETMFTRMADHLGFHDIDFESEEFNREFQVKCSDKKFANDVVDARMMQWLLSAEGWSFELNGPHLLCYHGRLKPEELVPLLGTMKAFREHVPRVAFELYGTGEGKLDAPEGRGTP